MYQTIVPLRAAMTNAMKPTQCRIYLNYYIARKMNANQYNARPY